MSDFKPSSDWTPDEDPDFVPIDNLSEHVLDEFKEPETDFKLGPPSEQADDEDDWSDDDWSDDDWSDDDWSDDDWSDDDWSDDDWSDDGLDDFDDDWLDVDEDDLDEDWSDDFDDDEDQDDDGFVDHKWREV